MLAARVRVRLDDTDPAPSIIKPAKPRVRLPNEAGGGDFSHAMRATAPPTPEMLAYAMPAGLAKLVYKNWVYAPHLKFIEDKILGMQAGIDGVKPNIPITIMFSAPPRHGKTQFISRILPPWYLGRNPDKRVLLITYQQDYSRTQSRAARNIFKAYGDKVFGLRVAEDTAGANHWDIAGHEGGMEAVGAGGAITGKGADLLIIDDLVKGFEEAMSAPLMEKRWEWFLTDVYSRIEPGGSVLIIMTRWSIMDVIGNIQTAQVEAKESEEEDPFEGWETINFPAIALRNDPLGRKEGEALFPQRYPKKKLLKIKSVQDSVRGSFWFEALYQGNPIPSKGDIIDITWFRTRWDQERDRSYWDQVIISADTASKDTELADYTVFQVWGIKDEAYYLIDVIRAKMEYPELKDTALILAGLHKPEIFLIEDKGSGISLLQDMRAESTVTVWPMDPGSESKIIRMQAETPVVRAGKIILPKKDTKPWLDEYLMEMRSFPRGRKDQVDATSQFLKFIRQGSSGIRMW